MDTTIINKNALYRTMIRKGKNFTYLKIAEAIDGEKDSIEKSDAMSLIEEIDAAVKIVKANITKSITSKP